MSALVLRTSGVSVSEDIMAVKRDTIQLQCALFLSKWYFFLVIFFSPNKIHWFLWGTHPADEGPQWQINFILNIFACLF